MNDQVRASVQFAKSFVLDPEQEFMQKRTRKKKIQELRKIPKLQQSSSSIQSTHVQNRGLRFTHDGVEYKDDTKTCLEKIKPLAQVLQLPISVPTLQQIDVVIQLLPPSTIIDPKCLTAEFDVFANIIGYEKESCKCVRDACNFAYRKGSIFPAVYNCFKLLFTAPVTVAKSERSFS